jgi:hypothetical protein
MGHATDRRAGTATTRRWTRTALRVAAAIAVIVAVLFVTFAVWALTPYRGDETARRAMLSDALVTVTEQAEGIVFEPVAGASTGLVLYPGGRVEAAAYAPLARSVAEAGYLVVIQPMPFNLAVFGIGRAERALDAYPEVEAWAVGGHSLGGAMAAQFVARGPASVSGLVLLAAYPAGSTNLSGAAVRALTLVGSEDGLVSDDEIEAGAARLPADARLVVIEGGNHAGFGSYGAQQGDGEATIDTDSQLSIATEEIAALLGALSR